MKELIRKLDAEYGFSLSEHEIDLIARQAEDLRRLHERIHEVDRTLATPGIRETTKE